MGSGARWERLRWPAAAVLLVAVVVVGALAIEALNTVGEPDRTTVTVVDENGAPLGTVEVRIAETFDERYTGLSNTDSLGPNEGMLFVHDGEAQRTYVMREMSFPIDIVFIGADRSITAIHHAPTEEPPLTRYRGPAKWVLEVPYHWTTDHGVSVDDRIQIERAD